MVQRKKSNEWSLIWNPGLGFGATSVRAQKFSATAMSVASTPGISDKAFRARLQASGILRARSDCTFVSVDGGCFADLPRPPNTPSKGLPDLGRNLLCSCCLGSGTLLINFGSNGLPICRMQLLKLMVNRSGNRIYTFGTNINICILIIIYYLLEPLRHD
jgi:hypothetical protein